MKLTTLKERAAGRLPQMMLILCLLQPVLDVASYWLLALELPNAPTTLLRFAMLAAVVLLGFLLSERKRWYAAMGAVLALLTAGHLWACSLWGYDNPVGDLANMVRIYQLPVMTLAFVTFFKWNRGSMESVEKGFFWCLILCAGVEVLSVATGTNPYTYPNKEVGILGWFYFANSQSAVVSALVPMAMVYALHRWPGRIWIFALISLLGTAVLYFFATRLAYACLLLTLAGLLVCLPVLGRMHSRQVRRPVAVLLVCIVLAAAGYSVSPMVKNNQMVARNKILKQQDIEEKVAADEAAARAEGLEGTALETARLRSAYETYLTGPTGRFGLERTAEWYDCSTDAGDIADVRREKITYNDMLMEDCPTGSYWFGLEREDMIFGGEAYDVENDFHGIFYLCGMVGLLLYLAFLGFFFLRIAAALIRDFRQTLSLPAVGCGLALVTLLIHAYFTCGVLRRPNVNIYLALLLAMSYGLTMPAERRKEVEA